MRKQQTTHRRGFTLIEMMIVVALVVIVASLSVPLIQMTLDDARVNASGDLVRGKMAASSYHHTSGRRGGLV